MRPKRDILAEALRNLRISEEIFCTAHTYAKIASRIPAIQETYEPYRFAVRQWDGLAHIRRTR